MVVSRRASAARSAPRTICHQASRPTRDAPTTANTTRIARWRRRESVRPIIGLSTAQRAGTTMGPAAGVEGFLADGRPAAEALDVRDEVLGRGVEALALGLEARDVVAGRRQAHV